MGEPITEREGALIDRVLRIGATEPEGDHYLSHWVFAKKVLRDPLAVALAHGYRHHRLTREQCEGLLADWKEAGFVEPGGTDGH